MAAEVLVWDEEDWLVARDCGHDFFGVAACDAKVAFSFDFRG